MTSSLVGSEMCIRDRSLFKTIAAKGASKGINRANKKIFKAKSQAPALRAVSYTHLTLPTICSV
eukprot:12080428-Prorocentrum_lima.AAC.1